MPLKDDLIERTIEGLVASLRALLGGRDPQAFDAVMTEIEEAYRRHTGAGRALMHHLSSDDLLEILSSAGHVDREKAYLIAWLLHAEARALERSRTAVPPGLNTKALDLFVEAALAGLAPDEVAEPVAELQAALVGQDLPTATLERLFDYRVLRGGYAGAEDLLFELLDRLDGLAARERLAARGRAFYRELDGLSDRQLREGGLPRVEVAEGRAAFEAGLQRVRGGVAE